MRTALFMLAIAFASAANARNDPEQAMTVSERGVGPINKNTPFDRKAIQKLLPHLEVKEGVSSTEDEEFPVLLVSDGKGLLFTIIPAGKKKIFSVVLENDRVSNELGHKMGQSYKQVFQGKPGQCYAGLEEYSGTVLCGAPNSEHLNYLFEGEWNGPDGQVPPQKILNGWKISSVVWKP